MRKSNKPTMYIGAEFGAPQRRILSADLAAEMETMGLGAGCGVMLKGEPEFVQDLLWNQEIVVRIPSITSLKGMLGCIEGIGRDAGFTEFHTDGRLQRLKRLFKKDESTLALSVPMERLRSGEVLIRRHILEIPEGFINEVYKIYQKWPFLAVAMVDAIVCHEEAHRNSKITGLDDKSKAASEAEASAYLLEKQGLWGVALFIWYFTYYLNTRATIEYCIEWFGFKLDREQIKQVDTLVKQIEDEYSEKGGETARRYRRKGPSRPAMTDFKSKMIGRDEGMFNRREDIILTPKKVELANEREYEGIVKKLISQLIEALNDYAERAQSNFLVIE